MRRFGRKAGGLVITAGTFNVKISVDSVSHMCRITPSDAFISCVRRVKHTTHSARVRNVTTASCRRQSFCCVGHLRRAKGVTRRRLILVLEGLVRICHVGKRGPRVVMSLSSFRFIIGLPHAGGGLRCRTRLKRLVGATLL